MEEPKSNEKVERAMYESTKLDHARIQLDKISRFGLMEMSRQRIKPVSYTHLTLPTITGV